MVRSLLAKSAPTVGTVAAMMLAKQRTGWGWTVAAGLGAHLATSWLVNAVFGALEGQLVLPTKPVGVDDKQVAPPVLAPEESSSAAEPPGAVEVLDKNNNVIQLPTAMGEP